MQEAPPLQCLFVVRRPYSGVLIRSAFASSTVQRLLLAHVVVDSRMGSSFVFGSGVLPVSTNVGIEDRLH